MCMCVNENCEIPSHNNLNEMNCSEKCEMTSPNDINFDYDDDDESNDYVFIDVQGFKTTGNIFIVKEFCLLYGDYKFHANVQSPYGFNVLTDRYRREANWLTDYFHGLLFDSGDITLTDLVEKTLKDVYRIVEDKEESRNVAVVVVKGIEKCKWVREMYKRFCGVDINCVNIEDLYPSFRFSVRSDNAIRTICFLHRRRRQNNNNNSINNGCNCALSHAQDLYDFFHLFESHSYKNSTHAHTREEKENLNNTNHNTIIT